MEDNVQQDWMEISIVNVYSCIMAPIVKMVWFYLFFPNKKSNNNSKKQLAINCPYISNEENAQWGATLANGQTINGTCLNGFNGFVSRSCIQIGSIGNWSSISGSCDGISFFKN